MNNVTLAGRLTADPELHMTDSGTEYAGFTLAVDRKFKDRNGQKQTDFIWCKAWSKTAVFLHTYFHKGDGVILDGRIETRRYEDKDGNNRTMFEVIANGLEFPQGRKSGEPVTSGTIPQPDFEEIVDDELPF
mgnify:CR=1 FL=1